MRRVSWLMLVLYVSSLATAGGCRAIRNDVLVAKMPHEGPSPRELTMINLPAYRVAPPDVLLIDAVKVVPKPPYRVEPLDVLQIFVVGTLPEQPIGGLYPVESDGTLALGPAYGSVKVSGLTLTEARDAIVEHLKATLLAPEVSVSLAESAGKQQITGEHLVGPDGTVTLGVYGSVRVSGLTLVEARAAVEEHLAQFLEDPEVAVDVFAYNSQVYYIITEGAGLGDQIQPIPITGNERVLDAIGKVGGLTRVSSKTIWVARPAPAGSCCQQILPVDWEGIKNGETATNWQILPGDRVFVAEDKLVALDNLVDKVLSPFERIVGFNLLTFQMIQTANRFPDGNFTGTAF